MTWVKQIQLHLFRYSDFKIFKSFFEIVFDFPCNLQLILVQKGMNISYSLRLLSFFTFFTKNENPQLNEHLFLKFRKFHKKTKYPKNLKSRSEYEIFIPLWTTINCKLHETSNTISKNVLKNWKSEYRNKCYRICLTHVKFYLINVSFFCTLRL